MADYSKLKASAIERILSQYGLELKNIEPQQTGISNSNYQLQTAASTFLLKICNDKSLHEFRKELEILAALKKVHFNKTVYPLSTQDGQQYFEFDGLYGALFPYIDGQVRTPNNSLALKLGESLALLHQLDVSSFDHIRSFTQIGFNYAKIKAFVDTTAAPDDYKKAFQLLLKDIPALLKEDLSLHCFIHGDFYFDNALFKGDDLAAMLDFEQAGLGPRLFDLGVAISGSCWTDTKYSPDLIKHYVSGYEEKLRLPPTEKACLVDAIILGLFSISLWRFDRFEMKKISPERKNSYQELLKRAQVVSHQRTEIETHL